MADGIYTSQDIQIKSCTITGSSGQSIDFKFMIAEFNIFEDIFNNTISGAMYVSDSMGYINILQLQGNEILTLVIDKPGLRLPIEQNFIIFSITNRETTRGTNENYIINFCSQELLLNEQYKISKSYQKALISDIVTDLCESFLKISSLVVEETYGLRDIVIPNFKPIQAINWLATLAVAGGKNNVGSPYFFYQNRDGYNFASILNLFQNPVYKTYQYDAKGLKSPNNPLLTDLNNEIVNVIQYEHIKNFNSADAIRSGAFANKLHTVDPLRLKLGETDFSYTKYAQQNAAKLNNYNIPISATNVMGDTVDKTPGVVKFAMTTTGQSENSYIKGKNITIQENLVEQTVPYRTAQLALFCMNRMKLLIPGDVYMSVGKIIEFNLPQIVYNNKNRHKQNDEFYSGKYLVTAVRHIFNQENKFMTVIEICKESYPSQFGSYNNADPQWGMLR